MPSCFYRPAEDGTGAGLVLCSRGYGYATSRYIFYRPAEDGTGAGLILIPTSNLNPKTRPNPNPDTLTLTLTLTLKKRDWTS